MLSKTFASSGTWVIGFAYKRTIGFPSSSQVVCTWNDTATEHGFLLLDSLGRLSFFRTGTTNSQLAISTNSLVLNTWYYIEIKFTIADSPSGVYEVRVNGSSTGWIPRGTGDTRNGANASVNIIKIWSGYTSAGSYTYIDDIYICDGTDGTATQGAPNNDFKGDVRVDSYAPVGNGTNSHWVGSDGDSTDNYALVSDGNVVTYVAAPYTTSETIDTYVMADVLAGTIPLMTQVNTRAKKSDAGSCALYPYVLSSGSVYTGVQVSVGITDSIYMEIIDKDPNSGLAWTDSTLNAAEFGIDRGS